ncbi:MAG: hypothetical protein ACYCSS_07405 [Sulfuriferula sp.]
MIDLAQIPTAALETIVSRARTRLDADLKPIEDELMNCMFAEMDLTLESFDLDLHGFDLPSTA